jgi:two-component system, LytTR family, sensor kinase
VSTTTHPDARTRWFSWWTFLAGLTGLSLLTMAQLLLAYRNRGVALSAREAFLSGVATWHQWALYAPLIFALCRRFPFEPNRWQRSLLVHLPMSLVVGFCWTTVRWACSFVPWFDEYPLWYWRLFISHFPLWFLAYWVLVSVHQAWHNYHRFRERELRASQLEAKLAQAQLEVLKMQLHPHFLFNTLHAISTLIHRDPDAADEMVAQLSDLLRMTLNTVGVQEVPLQQELEFLARYLDIQKMRFQDRLEVVVDVPPETLDVQVPNQVLQPIVENAVRHGVDARSGQGRIEVRARVTNHLLLLTVRDDGPGLHPHGQSPPVGGAGLQPYVFERRAMDATGSLPAGDPGVPRERRGIGLANTRARLRELYGPASTLSLENHPSGGTLVTLAIPLRRSETHAADETTAPAPSPNAPSAALTILEIKQP